MGLTNNDILKKLRVAHKLRTEDIVKIIGLAGLTVNKGQLNDLFRKDDHPGFVACGDQILRNFLDGLIIHLRGPMPKKEGGKSAPPKKIDKAPAKKIMRLTEKDKMNRKR